MNNTQIDGAWTLRVVARIRQGDRKAVRHLYARYAPAVRTHVAPLVRDPDAVEDVVQATFLELPTSLDRYEAREVAFETWLLGVARTTAVAQPSCSATGAARRPARSRRVVELLA